MLRTLGFAAVIALPLSGCGTTQETWLASLCDDAGHQAGSAEFGRCVEDRRAADAHADSYFAKYHGYK